MQRHRGGPAGGSRRARSPKQGLRLNIDVGIQYLEAWLRGNGCVPIYNLMEDAATAEISRAQVWQWVRHGAKLDDGRVITTELVVATMQEELEKLKAMLGAARFEDGKFELAAQLFETDDDQREFRRIPDAGGLRVRVALTFGRREP